MPLTAYPCMVPEEAGEATLELRLERGGTLAGRLAMAEGQGPIVEGHVEVHRPGNLPLRRGTPLAAATTDAAGRFLLEGVPLDERLVVLAEARGFVAATRGILLPSDGTGEREIEFLLEPGGFLEGVVRDAEGAPVEGALVLVAEADPEDEHDDGEELLVRPGISFGGDRFARTGRSGPGGEFEVGGLRLGVPHSAAAMADDHRRSPVERGLLPTAAAPRVRRDMILASGAWLRVTGLWPGVYRVNTRFGEDFRIDREGRTPAPSSGVRIVVARAGSAAVHLRVPAGTVPPVRVEVERVRVREDGRQSSRESRPWNEGRIRWDDLEPGRWMLGIRAKGFLEVVVEVEAPPGRELDLGEREFLPASSLEVRVTDPSGSPVAGAQVAATSDPEALELVGAVPDDVVSGLYEGRLFRGVTGGDGRVTLAGVSFADGKLLVTGEGFLPFTGEVRLPGGSPLAIVLWRGGVLEGRVLLPDGSAAASAILRF